VFFSDNGSTAVEVALKIALQYWHNRGEPKRKFVALAGAYHGDTFGAMAVGERSAFTAPFAPLLFEVLRIDSPRRGESAHNSLAQLEQLLATHSDIAGFIYEPLVQGAGGMIMHDADVLGQLIQRAKQAGVICIADEVMTGFGRTGTLFASSQLPTPPDIICLGKGITAGMLPLSVTVAASWIFAAFLSEHKEQAFLHGHSFTANSLGCRVGLASLELLTSPECCAARLMIEREHRRFKAQLEESPKGAYFSDIRVQGTILACELKTPEGSGYFNGLRDTMARYFIEQGVLLRPLGNVVYVLPPYCITAEELQQIYAAISGFVRSYF
jgi:adenosylmethionine-8-amino-7-oxononanoate aminotransferase